jgi:hypothetical protein
MALVGVLLLLGGLLIIAVGDALDIIEVGLIIGGFILVIGLLLLFAVWLLWSGKAIGWYLVMVILVLDIVFGVYSLATGDFTGLFGFAIAVFLAWYFLRPNVRAFFGT